MSTTVQVRSCTAVDELYCHYHGQSEPQNVYVELDLDGGALYAAYNPEPGNAVPMAVWHGRTRRWRLPAILTGPGANRVLEEIAPLAQQVLDGADITWDGSNNVAVLDENAHTAAEAIAAELGGIDADCDSNPDVLPIWDAAAACDEDMAVDYGITATTTDDELEAIEARVLADFRDGMNQPHAIVEQLDVYLQHVRSEQD